MQPFLQDWLGMVQCMVSNYVVHHLFRKYISLLLSLLLFFSLSLPFLFYLNLWVLLSCCFFVCLFFLFFFFAFFSSTPVGRGSEQRTVLCLAACWVKQQHKVRLILFNLKNFKGLMHVENTLCNSLSSFSTSVNSEVERLVIWNTNEKNIIGFIFFIIFLFFCFCDFLW